ncbi:MAG: NADH-quinone oxidoreductase subunit C [Candidatus Delongbacteria bacterium]|jgi:Ni,Fe-hydrogenase III large subunit|nr:NADH-quinone oxidoreductase subunit C [Candidatus Delongbacteria bacterium]MDD4204889.1 NADH-quinone oxidoreductase subunit C [Candidatus Delongbacteria bacterium]MDY0016590.1 NADH-quinone oxidoreductase subunit C [Candidatus Delongbacteria bacterium]
MKKYLETYNNTHSVRINDIPVLTYDEFCLLAEELFSEQHKHCLSYHAIDSGKEICFFCIVADDSNGKIYIFSHRSAKPVPELISLSPKIEQLQIFEREITENFGIVFVGHPWNKPVRYSHNRHDTKQVMNNYPFFKIGGHEIHEVGVGPIHAGIIEPGHFRFICNGEKVLHLEIHLGYQHRGIENLFVNENEGLKRCVLSESIAGDTSVGNALAHCQLIESLSEFNAPEDLQIERCIALELERIAVHIGDTSALCADVGYQLGQVVCEALRTTIINTTQFWCGNRFGKGLVRPFGTNYPLKENTIAEIRKILSDSGERYFTVAERIYSLPSVLGRFDGIGAVTTDQAIRIGAVGMAARTCNVKRDIRATHPFQYYRKRRPEIVIQQTGDALARGVLRWFEAKESIKYIFDLLDKWEKIKKSTKPPVYNYKLKPESFAVSAVEGWRGEICHVAFTDANGEIVQYKIKDASMHNWFALALSVRNQEISDFPICNKSFNLSYCGHDL